MYTVIEGPSKIAAKARRGLPQNIDRLETFRESKKSHDEGEIHSSPKPIFQPVNGKKNHSFRSQHSILRNHNEVISPQHEEIIRYIYDSWTNVCKENEEHSILPEKKINPSKVVVYEEAEPNIVLQDFKPFDLESWWGKRLFNNITKSIP